MKIEKLTISFTCDFCGAHTDHLEESWFIWEGAVLRMPTPPDYPCTYILVPYHDDAHFCCELHAMAWEIRQIEKGKAPKGAYRRVNFVQMLTMPIINNTVNTTWSWSG